MAEINILGRTESLYRCRSVINLHLESLSDTYMNLNMPEEYVWSWEVNIKKKRDWKGGRTVQDYSRIFAIWNRMECRYRDRVLHVRIFKMITCSMCYYWMYPQGNVFNARTPARPSKDPGNYSTDKLPIFSPTSTPIPTPAPNPIPAPDIENNTVMQLLCNMLGDEEKCQRWRDCCSAALACCHQQQTDDNVLAQNLNSPFCPRTWDGYTCWKDTPANSRVSNKCPDYVHEYVTPGSKYTWLIFS